MGRSFLFFVGTRPEIIKAAPVIHSLERRGIPVDLVHVGQHYDRELSRVFLDEFRLPEPVAELGVGSGSHAYQTAETMMRAEEVLGEFLPEAVLAVGDTNAVLGTALACTKLGIPFLHVEAGLRSFDLTMPEEINRRVTDHLAALNFAPTARAVENLLNEGIPPSKVRLTGNTVVDAVHTMLPVARERSKILRKLRVDSGKLVLLVTVHRRENLERPERLTGIVEALLELDEALVVWPLHPHAARVLRERKLLDDLVRAPYIKVMKSLGYLDFLKLLSASTAVATDSGGVQEEAFTLGVPCAILRDNTERPEIIELGGGLIVGAHPGRIVKAVRDFFYKSIWRRRIRKAGNPFGDGRAGDRIAEVIAATDLESLQPSSPHFEEGAPVYAAVRVGGRVNGMTVGQVQEEFNLTVVAVYDRRGRASYPEPGVTLTAEEVIKVLGERRFVERLRAACGR